MKMLKWLPCLLILAQPLQAATLADLQHEAVTNRQVLDRYQADISISRLNEQNARSSWYPTVDFKYTINQLDDDSLFENSENSRASGVVSWNVFSGFRDQALIRSAELMQRVADYKLAMIRQDIMLNVALRYLAIYQRQASLQVADDFYQTLLKVYRDGENRFQVGLIKKSDLLKFKVDLDDAEISLKKARAEVDKSIKLLGREIGGEVDSATLDFSIMSQPLNPVDPVEGDLKMIENRSELKVLRLLTEATEYQAKAEHSRLYPRVDFATSYSTFDDDYLATSTAQEDTELRAQLILTMNLYDGSRGKNQEEKALLEMVKYRSDLTELTSDLRVALRNLFLDFAVNSDNIGAALAGVGQAEENLRVTRLSYQEGLSRESELLDAAANLSRARYNAVAARTETYRTWFMIQRALEQFE
ncbi:MAG: TolC family protein [Proteobacteria bacterium]|nr:TolC family protein [Pseudomonadota bacterium]MBU1686953.1 TolC family protein [Pseudomonadota bacterium]